MLWDLQGATVVLGRGRISKECQGRFLVRPHQESNPCTGMKKVKWLGQVQVSQGSSFRVEEQGQWSRWETKKAEGLRQGVEHYMTGSVVGLLYLHPTIGDYCVVSASWWLQYHWVVEVLRFIKTFGDPVHKAQFWCLYNGWLVLLMGNNKIGKDVTTFKLVFYFWQLWGSNKITGMEASSKPLKPNGII